MRRMCQRQWSHLAQRRRDILIVDLSYVWDMDTRVPHPFSIVRTCWFQKSGYARGRFVTQCFAQNGSDDVKRLKGETQACYRIVLADMLPMLLSGQQQRQVEFQGGDGTMRVLLADDRSWSRSAIRLLLEQEPGVDLIGEATEVQSLLQEVELLNPDLLLLDWEFSELKPSAVRQLLAAIHSHHPTLRVIILGGRPESTRSALAAGADTFVSKADPPEGLLAALRKMQHDLHNNLNAHSA